MSNEINPLKADTRLLMQGKTIASNLVGFLCEVLVYPDKDGNVLGYRIQPELEMVEKNMQVYVVLKKFAAWYMEAHQHSTGVDKLRTFDNLVTAIFDFGMYWRVYQRLYPRETNYVVQICQQVLQAVGAEMAKDHESKKAGR